jgi:cytochrome-b5 reductase
MIVKAYREGAVSSQLHSLGVGKFFTFAGPLDGPFRLPTPEEPRLKEVRMVAGGTGVAPMYRIIRSVLSDEAHGSTTLSLVYASPLDPPPLHKELEALQQAHPQRLKLHYVLSTTSPPTSAPASDAPSEAALAIVPSRHYGRIDEAIVRNCWTGPAGDRSPLLISAPPGLLEMLCGKGSFDGPDPSGKRQPPLGGLLRRLGYTDREVVRL